MNVTRASIVPAALVVLLTGAPAATAQLVAQTPAIVAHGEATIKRAPERAWITMTTETRDIKAPDARQKGAEFMTAVQKALKDAGLPADAVRTTGYSLSPEYEWRDNRSTLKGYLVRNQIEVRVDNLDKVADVLEIANTPRGSTITVSGPRFDLRNPEEAQNEAVRAAVETAMARAQAMAAGARRSLGTILRIDEQSAPVMPGPLPMAFARAGGGGQDSTPTPIAAGDIEIHAQVTVTVEIR